MPNSHFKAETLDDLMRSVIEEIHLHGDPIHPTKRWAIELIGGLLELTNPRARLSRTETRGKLFSCLGELCWYLAKSNDLEFIRYYISEYDKYAEDGKIFGGYGPRLFNWGGLDQVTKIVGVLREKTDSRQAVIQLFDRADILEKHKDIPCTCTLQFLLRDGKLHLFTNMRSNDAYLGLPHDIFCFTMLQEIIARALSADIGTYKHSVGSLHLYAKDLDATKRFLDEGWQATVQVAMPKMPIGNPWPDIDQLLKVESGLRTAGSFDDAILSTVNPYWADLMRLLHVFRCKQYPEKGKIGGLLDNMASRVYAPFIEKVLTDLA